MYNDDMRVKKALEECFNTEEFTAKQLGAIIKFGKLVRYRCRSNSALLNSLRNIFPRAEFREVTLMPRTAGRKPYKTITVKVDDFVETDEDDGGEYAG